MISPPSSGTRPLVLRRHIRERRPVDRVADGAACSAPPRSFLAAGAGPAARCRRQIQTGLAKGRHPLRYKGSFRGFPVSLLSAVTKISPLMLVLITTAWPRSSTVSVRSRSCPSTGLAAGDTLGEIDLDLVAPGPRSADRPCRRRSSGGFRARGDPHEGASAGELLPRHGHGEPFLAQEQVLTGGHFVAQEHAGGQVQVLAQPLPALRRRNPAAPGPTADPLGRTPRGRRP